MELVTEVQIGLDSRFIFIGLDGREIDGEGVIGKSLYVGDYGALLKELQELRKDKARKDYLIDLFLRGTSIGKVSDKQIDAAIAKQKGE